MYSERLTLDAADSVYTCVEKYQTHLTWIRCLHLLCEVWCRRSRFYATVIESSTKRRPKATNMEPTGCQNEPQPCQNRIEQGNKKGGRLQAFGNRFWCKSIRIESNISSKQTIAANIDKYTKRLPSRTQNPCKIKLQLNG